MSLTDKDIREKLLSVSVPEALIPEALESFSRAKKLNSKTLLFTLTATEVALVISPFLKWKAEKLPSFLRMYDNDVSINGDRAEWTVSPEGVYRREVVPLDPKTLKDESGRPYNYYMNLFKEWHSRSIPGRFVWLGFRNRASWVNAQLGVYVDPEGYDDAGHVIYNQVWTNEDENGLGIKVIRYGNEWELLENKKFGKFTKRNVIGYKFTNVDRIKRLASVVYTVGAIRT